MILLEVGGGYIFFTGRQGKGILTDVRVKFGERGRFVEGFGVPLVDHVVPPGSVEELAGAFNLNGADVVLM